MKGKTAAARRSDYNTIPGMLDMQMDASTIKHAHTVARVVSACVMHK